MAFFFVSSLAMPSSLPSPTYLNPIPTTTRHISASQPHNHTITQYPKPITSTTSHSINQSARKPFSLTALLAATTRFSSRFVMMGVSGFGFTFPSTTSREYCARC